MANLLASVTSASSDTSSGSWTEITDMTSGSVAVAGTGSVIKITFSITPDDTNTDETARYRFTIDGTAISGGPVLPAFIDAAAEGNGLTMTYFVDGLTAANHTFAVEWITETGSPATATDRDRSLQVIEWESGATIKVDVSSTSSQADPATWDVMTDMTGTFTTASGAGHWIVANVPPAEGADASSDLQFAVDTTREGPMSAIWRDATNEYCGVGMEYFKTGLSAASHTFDLEWQASLGSNNTNTSLPRTFQVVEFDGDFTLDVDVSSVSSQSDPATWDTMTDMTGTMTPDGSDSVVVIIACGTLADTSTADWTSALQIADDGVREGAELWSYSDLVNGTPGFLLSWAKTGETAEIVWTLEWQRVTGFHGTSTTSPRTFQVIDFAAGGAPPAANPKGPLGHPLHGALGGPI